MNQFDKDAFRRDREEDILCLGIVIMTAAALILVAVIWAGATP